MKFFLLKLETFFENHPATHSIKYLRIDFAHCSKSIMANKLLSNANFLRNDF